MSRISTSCSVPARNSTSSTQPTHSAGSHTAEAESAGLAGGGDGIRTLSPSREIGCTRIWTRLSALAAADQKIATLRIKFCRVFDPIRQRIKRGRGAIAGDTLPTSPRLWRRDFMGARDPAEAIEILDLLLKFFGNGERWVKGRLSDRRGNRCLVGA